MLLGWVQLPPLLATVDIPREEQPRRTDHFTPGTSMARWPVERRVLYRGLGFASSLAKVLVLAAVAIVIRSCIKKL